MSGKSKRNGLYVENPQSGVPETSAGGLYGQMCISNADLVEDYLETLCSDGDVSIDPITGRISTDYQGGGDQPGTCEALSDMIDTQNNWSVRVDDAQWPHTGPSETTGYTGGGTGGYVTAPSPNNGKRWGAATQSGGQEEIPPWLVLGHELLGHAWMLDRGEHPHEALGAPARGEGGHAHTVDRENLIREEHGVPLRGGHRDPYCGESYYIERDDASETPQWSSALGVCEEWRDDYNADNGTSYTMTDRIPD